jgi:hypothetical protein
MAMPHECHHSCHLQYFINNSILLGYEEGTCNWLMYFIGSARKHNKLAWAQQGYWGCKCKQNYDVTRMPTSSVSVSIISPSPSNFQYSGLKISTSSWSIWSPTHMFRMYDFIANFFTSTIKQKTLHKDKKLKIVGHAINLALGSLPQ